MRVLHHPALGGARARNVGVRAARGDVLVFIDDDDIPVGTDWLAAHLANYADPQCLGVTGRHRNDPDDEPSPWYAAKAQTRCMGFMPLLKLPTTYVRHGLRIVGVAAVHGTNGSLRRSAVDRFGGWDEDTTTEDETSFALRAVRGMQPGEYFVFDPIPVVMRGLGVAGGLDKRFIQPGQFFARLLDFVHTILGRYFPWRVRLLYPLYLIVLYGWTIGWVWTVANAYRTGPQRLGASLVFTLLLPVHIVRTIAWSRGKRRGPMTPAAMRSA